MSDEAAGSRHPTRVVLVDDQSLLRAAFRMIFDETDDIRVVGEAADGDQGLAVVRDKRPDVVLMDIRMPGMDGVEATRRIREDCAFAKVLILTTFDLDEYVYDALRAGASGFLLKDTLAEDLLSAVRAVASGAAVTGPTVTRRLIDHYVRREPETSQAERLRALTARELEVLTMIARGRSNSEIAREMYLSDGTVRTHVGRIFAKLRLRDRVQAVILGYECGLVPRGRE
ncbi:response regulator [Nonomuraea jiangxiensis]|uniref:DNA-binding response regulator, NarL/FixJ family, contains REC and HTH domains n=1 Tax=Nonomuraea jiangxiensis TaxID=633440 RepID=A0A1G9I6W8_9ACTN|nr:response regulator transcription factor [Nonomuraea jiangxiensis]SDL20816.1 DNA-binding response regulator, NarL/FixJ family, contains REC and HTH domains [Nonomuraea jiangxiensis]